ncbi:DUF305 domain-containing protein [Lapillicoccus sp.]|uniref:DUF305 domain-containing protein n=1 Tax=Lapillicoccus sp. TaxID=1909287 RepID=UPI0025FB5912|nr:DUF305 domain-containing protein [Lapillicoccus sp.]
MNPNLASLTPTTRTLRRAALSVVAAATAVALTACGSSSTAGDPAQGMPGMTGSSSAASTAPVGPAASGPHNPADVAFAVGMIPHHRQAVTMAEMALTQATDSTVRSLATSIKAAQDPEIQAMSGWLTGWGQAVPASGHNMSQMGASTSDNSETGGSGMGGMMSDQEMGQLSGTSGAAFDRLWLQLMTTHHQGAVAMARTELTEGANTDAKQLAQSIIDSQDKEITAITTLLGTLSG